MGKCLTTLMLVAVSFFALHLAVFAEQESATAPAIEATWKVASVTWYGKESKDHDEFMWQFQNGNRFVMFFGSGRTLAGKYQLDRNKKPWQIEIETAEDGPELGGGGPRKGIVSIEGDRLKVCVAGSADAPRPKEMASEKGTLNILRVMKRVKDKD